MSFYSPIDRLAQTLPRPKGTGAEFMTELSKMPGYKSQEAEDRGLQALANLPKMERAQFMEALRKKQPVVPEVKTLRTNDEKRYGPRRYDQEEEEQMPRHESFTLPGGSNYREILLKHPQGEFKGVPQHFGGEPNILASVRAKDRLGPNGEKILHIEELQSDWHQQGRDKGYTPPDVAKQIKDAERAHRGLKQQLEEAKNESGRLEQYLKDPSPTWQNPAAQERVKNGLVEANNKIMELMPQVMKAEALHQDLLHKSNTTAPDAPFKKNWHEMALKKMIHHAAKNGYDAIAITPGREQADRYGLAKHISSIDYSKNPTSTGKYYVEAKAKDGRVVLGDMLTLDQIQAQVGKELANKIAAGEGQSADRGNNRLAGLDLEVGGEGMKGFYDKIVPNFLNQFGKKYGAKVGTKPLAIEGGIEPGWVTKPAAPREVPVHHFPITPAMREDVVKNGVPLYADGGSVPHLAIGGQGPKNWLKGTVEQVIEPLKATVGFMTPDRVAEQQRSIDAARRILGAEAPRATLEQMEREIQQSHRVGAINQWIERNLVNYIKKQMATHDDPIRKLAEQGIVHIPSEQVGMNRYKANTHRATYGAERLGESEEAKAWEDAADVAMEPKYIRNLHPNHRESWMEKADPKTQIFTPTDDMHAHYLGFDHLVDILKQDLAEGRIRPEQLSKVSIEQAVRRAHQYDQERKKAMAETALKAAEGMPVHKDYGNGFKWIELTTPPIGSEIPSTHQLEPYESKVHGGTGYRVVDKQTGMRGEGFKTPERATSEFLKSHAEDKLAEALKYEGDAMGHCVGGYCPDVASGKKRIFSLRDAKNEPHVTIEVEPKSVEEGIRNLPDAERQALAQEVKNQYFNGVMPGVRDEDKYFNLIDQHYVAKHGMPAPVIKQIKGKQNAKPKKDYIPYAQDFVKSGNWSDVGDARNAELRRVGDVFNEAEQNALKKQGVEIPGHGYLTGDQIQQMHNVITPPGKRLKYDSAGKIIGGDEQSGFAKGGAVKPIGYTKEQVTVSPNLDAMRYELESVKHYTKKVK